MFFAHKKKSLEEITLEAFLEEYRSWIGIVHYKCFENKKTHESLETYEQALQNFDQILRTQMPRFTEVKNMSLERKTALRKNQNTLPLLRAIVTLGSLEYPEKNEPSIAIPLKTEVPTPIKHLIECVTFSARHGQVLKMLEADPAKTIVFSIGAGSNPEQVMPSFTQSIAEQNPEEKISVYHIDNALDPRSSLHLKSDAHASIELKLLDKTVCFPSNYLKLLVEKDKQYPAAYYPEVASHVNALHEHLNTIVEAYAKILLEKKHQDPELKVVLLYSCDNSFSEQLKDLAKKLIEEASGFKLNEDLLLMHEYFETRPDVAIVYRDLESIICPNPILRRYLAEKDEPEEQMKQVKCDLAILEENNWHMGSIDTLQQLPFFDNQKSTSKFRP